MEGEPGSVEHDPEHTELCNPRPERPEFDVRNEMGFATLTSITGSGSTAPGIRD